MSKQHLRIDSFPSLPSSIDALADAASFTSTEQLAVAGRRIMAKHTHKLFKHLPGVLSGDDPHAIHQMRVSTRRLRASLQATGVAYQPKIVQGLYKRLRKLARALGEVRDRDVLLMRLRSDAEQREAEEHERLQTVIEKLETTEAQDDLQTAIADMQAERDRAHADLLRELGRKRTMRLLDDLIAFLTCPLEDVQAADEDLPLLVRHHAGGAIWREYESVLRFESIMGDASSEQLHKLRIACKHLRYTLELFEPALGDAADGVIKQVTAMQEHLGNLHDSDVAIAYLQHEQSNQRDHRNDATSDGTENQSIAQADGYVQTRIAERAQLLVDVEPLWQTLSGSETRSTLARLIAAL